MIQETTRRSWLLVRRAINQKYGRDTLAMPGGAGQGYPACRAGGRTPTSSRPGGSASRSPAAAPPA
eukprot:1180716-Prorocentrum_minimum.AAC.2